MLSHMLLILVSGVADFCVLHVLFGWMIAHARNHHNRDENNGKDGGIDGEDCINCDNTLLNAGTQNISLPPFKNATAVGNNE